MSSVLVLARHGQTSWHRPNRYTGSSDVPLDETGTRQASQLAAWAATQDLTAVASSDLDRAVCTAQPVAAACGLPLAVDPRLREIDFGVAEGLTLQQVHGRDPAAAERFVEDPVDGHFPGGEHPAAGLARFQAALIALGSGQDRRILAVAHSTIIRLAVCFTLGLPLAAYRRRLPSLQPAAVSILRLADDGLPVSVLAYNVPVSEGWRA